MSFSIERATFVVLLGLNGAGKSTLFSIVTHLYDSVTGEIRIFGHDVAPERRRRCAELGVVFQSRTLDLDLTVKQNMLYHGALHGIARRKAAGAPRELLDRRRPRRPRHDKVRHLSGGQTRRVEIARSLLQRPACCCSTSRPSASTSARADILEIVRSPRGRGPLGVLWATHLFDEVATRRPS